MATTGRKDDLGETVARAKGGDRAALEAVLADLAPSIHRFARRMCRNAHDADDVLQDTLLNVARHLSDFEGLTAPEAASALGITIDALKSRLHRAREALRGALRPLLEPSVRPASACPDIVAMWSKKLEGDLAQIDCASMEKHLAGCPACGAACDALKMALLACQRVRTEDVPSDVQARVKAAVRVWANGAL